MRSPLLWFAIGAVLILCDAAAAGPSFAVDASDGRIYVSLSSPLAPEQVLVRPMGMDGAIFMEPLSTTQERSILRTPKLAMGLYEVVLDNATQMVHVGAAATVQDLLHLETQVQQLASSIATLTGQVDELHVEIERLRMDNLAMDANVTAVAGAVAGASNRLDGLHQAVENNRVPAGLATQRNLRDTQQELAREVNGASTRIPPWALFLAGTNLLSMGGVAFLYVSMRRSSRVEDVDARAKPLPTVGAASIMLREALLQRDVGATGPKQTNSAVTPDATEERLPSQVPIAAIPVSVPARETPLERPGFDRAEPNPPLEAPA